MDCIPQETQNVAEGIICFISLISGILNVIIILALRVFESLTIKILISISANFILQNLLFLLGYYLSGVPCLIISYYRFSLLLSSMIWAGMIPKILHDVLVEGKESPTSYFKYCNIICYIIIPAIYTLPFITNSYVGSEDHCAGVLENTTGIIWRFSILYFPAVLISIKIIIYYIKIYKHLKKNLKVNLFEFIVNRGLIYTIIFVIINFLLIIARIIELLTTSCVSVNLIFIAICFVFSLGAINTILTLIRSDVRKAILIKIKGLKRTQTDTDYSTLLIN